MNKKITTITAVVALVAGMAYYATTSVKAASTNPVTNLVDALVSKFGLKKEEVAQVFATHRQQRQQEVLDRFNERVGAAVAAGKLTKQQGVSLKAKMKLERAENQGQGVPGSHHQEMLEWAKTQGIDLSAVFDGQSMMGGRGRGMMGR